MARLEEAEGFADLLLWTDAWETLDALDPDERASRPVLRLRLRCCPAMKAWETGKAIAHSLRDGSREDREAAARFYQALALNWVEEGDHTAAGASLAIAAQTWPEALKEQGIE